MPKALEVVTGFVTAPGATLTAWTMAAGNSLTIRNAKAGSMIRLLQIWADNQAAGTLRIRSPLLHDNVQGIRLDIVVSEVKPLLPYKLMQPLQPQDVFVAEQSGSGVAGDIETGAFLVFYEDLTGVDARLMTVADVMARMKNILTVENTIATGVAGGYSGEEAIDAEFDLLHANTDYAILGYLVDTECAVVRWRGSDLGNLGVGGPGDDTGRDYTASWFLDLARMHDLPLVPVFNAANKGALLIDAAQDENGADVTVTTILGELKAAA